MAGAGTTYTVLRLAPPSGGSGHYVHGVEVGAPLVVGAGTTYAVLRLAPPSGGSRHYVSGVEVGAP